MQRTISFALVALSLFVVLAIVAHAADAELVPVTIDTPDVCVEVERISGNAIYLKRPDRVCSTTWPAKIRIMVGKDVEEIDIYVDGLFFRKQRNAPFEIGDVSGVMNKAKKASDKMQPPMNEHDAGGFEKAYEINEYYRTDHFQAKVGAEEARLKKEVFGNNVTGFYPDASSLAKAGNLSAHERIYIFISSSMPLETVRTYVKAISMMKDHNIRLVMRGFIGGMRHVKPTMTFIKNLLLEDPSCNPIKGTCTTYDTQVIIDPMLFARYAIDRVPAFVYTPSISVRDTKMSEGLSSNAEAGKHVLLYGDVGLDYTIEQIMNETKSVGLEKALKAYRGSFYR